VKGDFKPGPDIDLITDAPDMTLIELLTIEKMGIIFYYQQN
jgi:hypothetical protein